MNWLLRRDWLWSLVAFLLGATLTWRLLTRPHPPLTQEQSGSVGEEENGELVATQARVRHGVPPGRYGEGSSDAVPHQGPPDGFTIKGNAHSMLFHTPDSPYYGRTKPEVWFRTEADAERAGFTKYTPRPRKPRTPRNPPPPKDPE